MKRVTEVITINEIKSWKEKDIITISAGTGAGKSYFVKNVLYAYAKAKGEKILMLIHRANCVNQFQKELEKDDKTDVIDVFTYQKIEWENRKQAENDLSQYKYIVCDEFHYFMSDASFNKTTDISLKTILESKNSVKIFTSATGGYVRDYIKHHKKLNTLDFNIDIDFNFIKKIRFFSEDEVITRLAEEIVSKNRKAIFFIQSAEKAYKLHKHFKSNSIFNCSKSNQDFYKYVNEDVINNMLQNERFDSNILFTTLCMDAGVNIIDDDLKYILCDVEDTETLIQCIGRKRLKNKKDYIELAVKAINNNRLGGLITQAKKRLLKADYLLEHGEIEYVREYGRDSDLNYVVYDKISDKPFGGTEKVVNELTYFKSIQDINKYSSMLNDSYEIYLLNKLNLPRYKMRKLSILQNEEKDMLYSYLTSIINKRLYKNEKKELIETLSLRDSNRNLQKSIKVLDSYLQENYNLTLINGKRDNRRKLENGENNPNFQKSYWYIKNLSLN
ncbi:DEAD/DEAH box helicase family protein [Paraclostridium sordellii]|uniref:DEAD/DEAH box helicase family protein n=1 Tax=Paraclostridium sordellii TaxID=1505 RepID=UPI0005E73500|nr:DEAD/DEAH box helicase family protein [Paeniclostridium sordellii]CEN94311.1 DNA/RNA helicase [[Clostridium] sordellii] [Paeniclostridium sordellii]CEN94664.1 DNA/RNA helicase [[Clostridium] sordellii] [Paeniclostridium sordellii]